jgi:uncharacterized protein YbjT (DUF2867 family)
MSNILITGANGNIGLEVIKFLSNPGTTHQIIAGVRNTERAKSELSTYSHLGFVHFDFENPDTFGAILQGIDRIFLMRPPHISDIGKYFMPLISALKKQNVRQIVFLSVQGAEKSMVIPHNQIERLIKQTGIDYIFLRPSYFMQNLTTTLRSDIQINREIILPAGKAKFNWIDIENIGEVAAILLQRFNEHKNRAFEITGLENENFEKIRDLINQIIHSPVRYHNVNPLRFFLIKKKQGMANGMILVMILLHFLPRFQPEPLISDFYSRLTGKKPTDLRSFMLRESAKFEQF